MRSHFLLLCTLLVLVLGVSAAPYIVTSYVVISVYTYNGYTISDETYSDTTYPGTTRPSSITTYTRLVAAPSSSVSALSTITASNEYYEDVTVVNVVLESGTAASVDFSDYTATSYVVPVTYTPDPTCTGQNWTFSTNVPIYIPDIVSPTPVTLSTSTTTYSYVNYRPTPQTAIVAVVNPTDVDSDDLASASTYYAPYQISYCYTPSTTCPTATGSQCTPTWVYDSNYYSSSTSYSYDYDRSWITPLVLICVLVPVGWFLIWLFIGLFESWLSFKGLMLGQHRKRGLPYAWCCISVLFLCWTGPTYKAKSVEEQAVLLERWKELKKREKFKLWMKWGFRWKYPDMLGEEPELAKRAFRQGCL